MPIVQAGEVGLRRPAYAVDPLSVGSAELTSVIDALRAGLEESPGVGLAAPQVGIPLRVVLIHDRQDWLERVPAEHLELVERSAIEPYVLINPDIEMVGSERRTFFEGCLSVEGYSALVQRALIVRARWLDPEGNTHEAVRRGWHARILQHEVDHLNGILYVDRMFSRSFMSSANAPYWAGRPPAEVMEAFGVV